MAIVTATTWVPRGLAAPFPVKYDFDQDEFSRIVELAKLQVEDAQDDLDKLQDNDGPSRTEETENIEIDQDLKQYDLEHYNDDPEDSQTAGQTMGMFGNVKSLAYYESNKDDPYITLQGGGSGDEDDDEREELQILATDNLLVAAKIEDELAHLEIYVYEDQADNLYVHHDIMLPAYPLCIERLDIPVAKQNVARNTLANFVAVGTLDPDIEIWDLDTIDCMYPNAILGQNRVSGLDSKRKKKKAKKANDDHHVDAVLSLATNRKHRNLLASASADKTVKLWDLYTAKCAKSYLYHTDKVCSLAWHAAESTVLLSGSYDRTVATADMRAPNVLPSRVGVESDVENVRWNPHEPNCFFVSTESGMVHCFDARNATTDPSVSKSIWKLQAHDESVSTFELNLAVPGFMVTGSTDNTVKLWNIKAQGPAMVVSRDLDVGKVFSATFAPDTEVAFRLAVAGSKGTVSIWDTSTSPAVRNAFGSRVPTTGDWEGVEDRVVGIEDDDKSESSEEDDNGAESKQDEQDDEDMERN